MTGKAFTWALERGPVHELDAGRYRAVISGGYPLIERADTVGAVLAVDPLAAENAELRRILYAAIDPESGAESADDVRNLIVGELDAMEVTPAAEPTVTPGIPPLVDSGVAEGSDKDPGAASPRPEAEA